MRVEFIGLPGSGKSTLATACHEILQQREVPAARLRQMSNDTNEQELAGNRMLRNDISRLGLHAALRYRLICPEAFDYFLEKQVESPKLAYFALELLAQVVRAKSLLDGGTIGFCDEGIIHRAAAINVQSPDPERFFDLVRALPDDFVFVYQRLSVAEAIERALQRTKGTRVRRYYGQRDNESVFAEYYELFENAVKIRQEISERVIVLDGSRPVEENARLLAKEIVFKSAKP